MPTSTIPPFRGYFDVASSPLAARNALGVVDFAAWTPVLTFATPGDLTVVYSAQVGSITSIGSLKVATFNIVTSTFTHTTASGSLQITGLPFRSKNVPNLHAPGPLIWAGITKAGFTQISSRVNSDATVVDFLANASGSALSAVTAADMPTGGTVILRGQVIYHT